MTPLWSTVLRSSWTENHGHWRASLTLTAYCKGQRVTAGEKGLSKAALVLSHEMCTGQGPSQLLHQHPSLSPRYPGTCLLSLGLLQLSCDSLAVQRLPEQRIILLSAKAQESGIMLVWLRNWPFATQSSHCGNQDLQFCKTPPIPTSPSTAMAIWKSTRVCF